MTPPQATDPAGEPSRRPADLAADVDALLAAAQEEATRRSRSANEPVPGSGVRRREGGPTAEPGARGDFADRGLTPRDTVVSPPPARAAPRREAVPPVSVPLRPWGRSRSAVGGGVAGPWAILREFSPVVLVLGLASCVAGVIFAALALELYAAGTAAIFAAVLAMAGPATAMARLRAGT